MDTFCKMRVCTRKRINKKRKKKKIKEIQLCRY